MNSIFDDSKNKQIHTWADKNTILQHWSGLTIYTLNRFIREMRANKKFRDGVVNPTHKSVFIRMDIFEEFLRYKDRQRYKR
ncbi:DNA-binding protein [Streptococcus hyovaginalis]|uniref:DNA-binding protein n=1 Tax=Streptococcus hyovaginalis TaxID=149015 RepID=UPI0014784137|nr:DNA-binding protein [Streptococcus hyovaginalis]